MALTIVNQTQNRVYYYVDGDSDHLDPCEEDSLGGVSLTATVYFSGNSITGPSRSALAIKRTRDHNEKIKLKLS